VPHVFTKTKTTSVSQSIPTAELTTKSQGLAFHATQALESSKTHASLESILGWTLTPIATSFVIVYALSAHLDTFLIKLENAKEPIQAARPLTN
jgi:hypothetical protein